MNNDGSGLFGSGIFGDSVSLFDISTWTWAEWATALGGGYVLISLFSTTARVGRSVKRGAGAPGRVIGKMRKAGQRRRKSEAAAMRFRAKQMEAA
jgi:hypothetical protein